MGRPAARAKDASCSLAMRSRRLVTASRLPAFELDGRDSVCERIELLLDRVETGLVAARQRFDPARQRIHAAGKLGLIDDSSIEGVQPSGDLSQIGGWPLLQTGQTRIDIREMLLDAWMAAASRWRLTGRAGVLPQVEDRRGEYEESQAVKPRNEVASRRVWALRQRARALHPAGAEEVVQSCSSASIASWFGFAATLMRRQGRGLNATAARSLIDTASTSRTASVNPATRRRRTKWREVSAGKEHRGRPIGLVAGGSRRFQG